MRNNTNDSSAKGLGLCLRRLFATFGVPEELSSDGGAQFTAGETRNLLQRWGVRHRISSAHHPKSNGRAEVAAKATKRLLNALIHPMWRDAWNSKESALRSRYARTIESLDEHARPLNPLQLGDRVYLQNQVGNHPKKWDRCGTVVECRPFNQYVIKVDGTDWPTVD